jgi:fatty-acyl-CoA synthase
MTGHRIFLSEIENCVEEYPGVLDCVAFTVPGSSQTQTLHVAVVSETSTQIDKSKLRETMRHRLGSAGVPESVLLAPRIPRNYAGVSDRPLLAQLAIH